MGSLISMAVYDLEGTGRTELTERTFQSLLNTVDFRRHRIVVIDNASCDDTQKVIMEFAKCVEDIQYGNFTLVHNRENVGTAKAVNMGLKLRAPGQHCIKMDNDIEIHYSGWIEELEEAIRRQPSIGILGLKRKDLIETPWNPDVNWRSELVMLPQKPGEKWIVMEKVNGVMGTCTMYNSALLDKIGYLYQPFVYGYDDSLVSLRSALAGFVNGFLPYIEIDHPDPGGTDYQDWKVQNAGKYAVEANSLAHQYQSGKRSIYEEA